MNLKFFVTLMLIYCR